MSRVRVPQDADGGVIEINVPIYLFLPADSWESDAGGGVLGPLAPPLSQIQPGEVVYSGLNHIRAGRLRRSLEEVLISVKRGGGEWLEDKWNC